MYIYNAFHKKVRANTQLTLPETYTLAFIYSKHSFSALTTSKMSRKYN